ncbi:SDR family oxidoreductase [Natronococcus sp. A-GB1]|uniref:SDR family NAD(P)-dependent oxidoreductase n=1 Tax=Natronococcus sp. A-GB1 TaxID=3037648 RepID=UPI00241F6677|nr:SDR family oxidoreductase [Natronococcus sp. A-GB1]MDG5760791.1 SDR family oxidoreductase [Natronococcus sp. A-GB1]
MPTPTYDFDGTTVLVTGGSSGIGRAIARRFGDAGATVLNADLREAPKDVDAETPTHLAIREAGGEAEYVETDVSQPADLTTAVEAAREFGGVDVMVNNAAVIENRSLDEWTPEAFDRLFDVNVRGTFFGTQAAATDMRDREADGCIINTASISGRFAQPNLAPYEATKAAIRMLTRSTALELAADGIRANAIVPGKIATEFLEGLTEDQRRAVAQEDTVKPVPLARAGTPADIAGAALFLACDDAGYVTGELLHVDGGYQVV